MAEAIEPLEAASVVGISPSIREPLWHQGRLFWLEQRPNEGGRTTLLMREPLTPGAEPAEPIELTPAPWNLRSRVHDYGGGVVALGAGLAVVVNDLDRCLWCLDLESAGPPRRLTEPADRAFAGGLIDGARQRWIGVMEAAGSDQLVSVELGGGEPQLLHCPADFCGYPALSPTGSHLSWVEWQQPFMPWQRSQLRLGRFEADGSLGPIWSVAGSGPEDPQPVSVFQPLWLPNGDLVVANDRSGWWNLELLPGADGAGEKQPADWVALLPREAEFAMPQWVYGMATTAWDGEALVAAACVEGRWQLGRLELAPARWQPIPLPFDDLAYISAENGQLACVASGPRLGQGLLELELATGIWSHRPVCEPLLAPETISAPEPLWFEGDGGLPTHAWYYPPQGGAQASSPLLVKSHSGPTAMARTGLNLAIQFWTSRGWGVVDVNYGGSTGFGRAYRERLDGQWGVADVNDCTAAAGALVASGRASPQRIAIEGGSAGGFTSLCALCFTDVFRCGAVRYGVADPAALARDTHRFEARYLDGLIGPWPEARECYEQRSPLLHAGKIKCPLIFFQGLDDKVVPPEQTEQMAAAIKAHGLEVEVLLFENEGHGFRSGAVQLQVLEATEAFFRRVLAL